MSALSDYISHRLTNISVANQQKLLTSLDKLSAAPGTLQEKIDALNHLLSFKKLKHWTTWLMKQTTTPDEFLIPFKSLYRLLHNTDNISSPRNKRSIQDIRNGIGFFINELTVAMEEEAAQAQKKQAQEIEQARIITEAQAHHAVEQARIAAEAQAVEEANQLEAQKLEASRLAEQEKIVREVSLIEQARVAAEQTKADEDAKEAAKELALQNEVITAIKNRDRARIQTSIANGTIKGADIPWLKEHINGLSLDQLGAFIEILNEICESQQKDRTLEHSDEKIEFITKLIKDLVLILKTKIFESELIAAIESKNELRLKGILKDPTIPFNINSSFIEVNGVKMTLLQRAIDHQLSADFIQFLVSDLKANPMLVNKIQENALHQAATNTRDARVMEHLLSIPGIDINSKDSTGDTPFSRALISGSMDVATLLLKKGADCSLNVEQLAKVRDTHFNELIRLLKELLPLTPQSKKKQPVNQPLEAIIASQLRTHHSAADRTKLLVALNHIKSAPTSTHEKIAALKALLSFNKLQQIHVWVADQKQRGILEFIEPINNIISLYFSRASLSKTQLSRTRADIQAVISIVINELNAAQINETPHLKLQQDRTEELQKFNETLQTEHIRRVAEKSLRARQALLEAIEAGDEPRSQSIIAEHVITDINSSIDEKGGTFLHYALERRLSKKTISFLIEANAFASRCNTRGENALHLVASFKSNIDIIDLVTKRSPTSLNVLDNEGNTPFVHAMKAGNFDAVKTFMMHGANTDITAKQAQNFSKGNLNELMQNIEEMEVRGDSLTVQEKKANKKLKSILDFCFKEKEKVRIQQEIEHFGKPLSPILLEYFETHFPDIKNLHQQVDGLEKMSPFGYAFVTNNVSVVRELFRVFGVKTFCDKEDKEIFQRLAFKGIIDPFDPGKESQISDGLQSYILKEIAQTKEHAIRPFICMSNRLAYLKEHYEDMPTEEYDRWFNKATGTNILEERARYLSILHNNLKQFTELRKHINLIAGMPYIDFNNLGLLDGHQRHDKLSFLGTKSDVEQMEDTLAKASIKKAIKNLFDLYKNSGEEGQHHLARFSNFMVQLLQIIPEKHYKIVYDEMELHEISSFAIAANHLDMLTLSLEYGPKLTEEQVQKALFADIKKKAIDGTNLLNKYNGSDELITMLLHHFQANSKDYEWEDVAFIPALPIHWSAAAKDQLHELLKVRFVSKPKEEITNWTRSFEKPAPLVSLAPVVTDFVLDDRTFANINNDHNLGGSHLQGNVMGNSLKYYIQFFNATEADPHHHLTDVSKEQYRKIMDLAKKNMTQCLAVEQMHDRALDILREYKPGVAEKVVNDIAEELLKNLKENKDGILIPGGWKGTPGHAMVYELRKTKKGYAFIIHNSGDGIQHHAQKTTEKGTYYSTLKVYEIPSDSIERFENQFKKLFVTLTKPIITPAAHDGKKLYDEIAKTAEEIGLQETNPEDYDNGWTRSQMSGTCSWQAFRSYFTSFTKQHGVNYHQLSYDLKRYSINEYLHLTSANKTINDGVVQRQISFATQNMARHIHKMYAKKIISDEKLQEGLELIERVNRTLVEGLGVVSDSQHPSELPQYVSDEHIAKKINSVPSTIISSLTSLLDKNVSEALSGQLNEVSTVAPVMSSGLVSTSVTHLKSSSDLNDAIQVSKVLTELLRVSEVNFRNQHHSIVAQDIEQFYLKMPLNNLVWKDLSKSELAACLGSIQSLNTLYLASIAKQNVVPFAERAMALNAGLCIGQQIVESYFKEDKNLKAALLNNSRALDQINRLEQSPYFTFLDGRNVGRLQQIRNQFIKIHNRTKDFDQKKAEVDVVQQIISRDPLILKRLLKLQGLSMDKGSSAELAYAAAIFYCKRRGQLKNDPTLLGLEQDLSIFTNLSKLDLDAAIFSNGELDSANIDIDTLQSELNDRKTTNFNQYKRKLFTNPPEIVGSMSFARASAYKYTLTDSQTPIRDKMIRSCLESRSTDSNTIQTSTLKGVVTEQVDFERSLLTTRVDKRIQVCATVDFMKKEFLMLIDPDVQQFVLLNLFHSDLLHKQLKVNPAIINDLIDLFKRGFDTQIKDKRLNQSALYFLKMSQYLEAVISSIDNPVVRASFSKQFKALSYDNLLHKEIEYYEQLPAPLSEHTKGILRQLHLMNVVHVRNQIRMEPSPSAEILRDGLTSQMAIKSLPSIMGSDDPFLEHQAIKASSDCQQLIHNYCDENQNSAFFQNYLNKWVTQYGIIPPLTPHRWIGTYPTYRLLSENNVEKGAYCTINVLTSQIIHNEHSYVQLPLDICNDPVYREICGERDVKAKVNEDQTIYEFTIKDMTYCYNTQTKSIYRQMTVAGTPGWYQYYDRSKDVYSGFLEGELQDVEMASNHSLPHALMQRGITSWVAVEQSDPGVQQTILIDEAQKKMLCSYDTQGDVSQLSLDGVKTGFKLVNSQAVSTQTALLNFDTPQFIQFWKKDGDPVQLTIHLDRYGLTFKQSITADGTPGDIIWAQDPRYKLKIPKEGLISGFNNLLHLEAISSKGKLNDLVLLPKQEFLAEIDYTPDRDPFLVKKGENYKLSLDTSLKVMRARSPAANFFDPHLHQYSNKEQYATLNVLPSGKLIAEKPEDGIYLAYVYLARRQPLLAMDALLKARQDSATLSTQQIQWLQRIILETTAIPERETINNIPIINLRKKAVSNTPEIMAVRVLAASFLMEQKLKKPPVVIEDTQPKKIDTHVRILEQEYKDQLLTELRSFWDDKQFYELLLPVYNDYFRRIRHLPDGMRLDDRQEHEMLRQFMQHLDPSEIPAHIKFRRRELSKANLSMEILQLETLKINKPDSFPIHYEQRLQHLKKQLEKNPTLQVIDKKIRRQQIMLIPDKQVTSKGPLDWELLQRNRSTRYAKLIPTNQLGATTNDADFLFSFQSYYNKMIKQDIVKGSKGKKISRERDALRRERIIRALDHTLSGIAISRHKDPDGVLSLRDNLSLILRYAGTYPHAFSKTAPTTKAQIEQALTKVHQLIKEGKVVQQDVNVSVDVPAHLPIKMKQLERAVPLSISATEVVPVDPTIAAVTDLFQGLHNANLNAEVDTTSKLDGLHYTLEQARAMEPIKKTLYDEIQADYGAGLTQNKEASIRNKTSKQLYNLLIKESATEAFVDSGMRRLNAKVQSEVATQTAETNRLLAEIIALANQPPPEGDPRRISWDLKRAGQEHADLDSTQIFHLFLMQDKSLYQQKTSLTEAQIDTLNNLIFTFLIKATAMQKNVRLQEELGKLINTEFLSAEERDTAVNKLGMLLDLSRCYPPKENPELLIFEYLDNKLLFKSQYDYIKALLEREPGGVGFKSQAVQLIMGGGKSKVLLPLLALKKATGTNLSIIEVPDALFQLNKADLSATTKKTFGQKVHPFYFNDSVVCDISHLRHIRNDLREAVINREYVITTKESMQSFELQYLKFLKYMNENNPNHKKIAKLFTEILTVFKSQGDVIIDEVDSTLDVRKQLIYTVGTGEKVPTHELLSVFELHKFFGKVRLENDADFTLSEGLVGSTLEDVLLGKKSPASSDWKPIFKLLTKKLLTPGVGSPLDELMNYVTEGKNAEEVGLTKQELYTYLMGQSSRIPLCITNLVSAEESNPEKIQKLRALQDRVALYKEEITAVLPLTFKKNMEEHFGLSSDPTKSSVERELAIPFLASNTPSEKSKFGNYLETINYTLRIQLYKPLSESIVKTMVMHFKTQEEEELKQDYTEPRPEGFLSQAAIKFQEITGQRLSSIALDEPKTITAFYETIKSNQSVKEYCILNHILNHVEKTSLILASDAQNHSSQFRSVQGMTGTDWNYRCYPDRMKTNKAVSMGVDGQTRGHLLKGAQPVRLLASAVTKEEKMNAMWQLFAEHPQKSSLHAWIDLGAYFKGITNSEVAHTLADRFTNNPASFSDIQFVLFFSEDKLYALRKAVPPNIQKELIPIEYTDADYIKATLGVGPEHTFTYYDQRRITGTDIKQAPNAHAFVPLGLKTMDRDVLQGVMRLRDLKNEQKIDFVIPKEVQDAYPNLMGVGDKATQWNATSIMKLCIDNQIERLADDHYRSGIQKIKNTVREHLFNYLLSADPETQKKWMTHFDQVFFTASTKSAFEQFGGVHSVISTDVALNEYAQKALEQWIHLMREANIKLTYGDIEQMQLSINTIVRNTTDICNRHVEQLKSEHSLLDQQVEVSKEKETSKEEERENEMQYQAQNNSDPCLIKNFESIDFITSSIESDQLFGEVPIKTLEHMASNSQGVRAKDKAPLERTWSFSSNIFVTENYSKTYYQQPKQIDGYKKEATFFLVEQDASTSPTTLKFLLLTNEEAGNLANQLERYSQKDSPKKLWIESVHHTIVAGVKPPQEKLHADYKKGIEQIAYLNGDTSILYSGYSKDSWLNEESAEKLTFLEDVIQPIHKNKSNMLDPLKSKMKTAELDKQIKFSVAVGEATKPESASRLMKSRFFAKKAKSEQHEPSSDEDILKSGCSSLMKSRFFVKKARSEQHEPPSDEDILSSGPDLDKKV